MPRCICGHEENEHAETGFFRRCLVECPELEMEDGLCPCGDFEEDPEAEEGEPETTNAY